MVDSRRAAEAVSNNPGENDGGLKCRGSNENEEISLWKISL